MNYYKLLCVPLYITMLGFNLVLSGCSSSSSGASTGLGDVSTNYPYLKSTPQVSFIQNVYAPTSYDVTVTIEADGPDGVLTVDLWLFSKDDNTIFEHLDLQYVGGTTWTATTYSLLPLPAGNYYIDAIMLQDGDPFDNGLVKSGWYNTGFLSDSHYDADQRLTNWDPANLEIIEFNLATSSIPVVNFTMP